MTHLPEVEIKPGTTIEKAAPIVLAASRNEHQHEPVQFTFNGIELIVFPSDEAEGIVGRFYRRMREREIDRPKCPTCGRPKP